MLLEVPEGGKRQNRLQRHSSTLGLQAAPLAQPLPAQHRLTALSLPERPRGQWWRIPFGLRDHREKLFGPALGDPLRDSQSPELAPTRWRTTTQRQEKLAVDRLTSG